MQILEIRFFKFLFVGIFNTAIGLTVICLAMWLFELGPLTANTIGYAIGCLIGYFLNRIWTFGGENPKNSFLQYMLVILVCYGLNLLAVQLSIEIIELNPYIAQFFGMATYTITSFIGCKTIVFKSNTNG